MARWGTGGGAVQLATPTASSNVLLVAPCPGVTISCPVCHDCRADVCKVVVSLSVPLHLSCNVLLACRTSASIITT